MAKWRVWAEEQRKRYLDVEAETEDQAWEIAENADLAEFTEDETYNHCELERPYRIYDHDEREFKIGERVKIVPNPIIKKRLWEATGTIRTIENGNICIDFDKKSLKVFNYSGLAFEYIVHED